MPAAWQYILALSERDRAASVLLRSAFAMRKEKYIFITLNAPHERRALE
jgi:hypothetical protein